MTIDENPNICMPEDEKVMVSLCEECTIASVDFSNYCVNSEKPLEGWSNAKT